MLGFGSFCFSSYLSSFSSELKLISFLNMLFFGTAFVTAVTASSFLTAPLASGARVLTFPGFVSDNSLLLFLFIFAFNVTVAAFAILTLPGFVFFPLSVVALAYRGVLWGLLFYSLSSTTFLVLLPVVVLEGEAYVLASMAGTLTGFSWINPRTGLGRRAAFEKALRECMKTYLSVAVLLFASAAVETVAIMVVPT